jgi:hypothetical protein
MRVGRDEGEGGGMRNERGTRAFIFSLLYFLILHPSSLP